MFIITVMCHPLFNTHMFMLFIKSISLTNLTKTVFKKSTNPRDLLSAFPHSQFHTLPGLLDSWAALPNSNPNACMPMQGGSLYHFYDGLWYDPAKRRTHDLPCERRTRYRLSQPDTVRLFWPDRFRFHCPTVGPNFSMTV